MSVERYLDTWDYVTMVTLVLASSLIGLYHIVGAKKIKNPKHFVVSGQNAGLIPLVLSITATSSSAVQILSFPLDSYFNGINFLLFGLSAIFAAPLCSHLYLPVFYKFNKNTVYEYLELRFSKTIRLLTSVLVTVQILFSAACTTYAPALVINQVTGLHLWTSIILVGVICILYTALGGFSAVIWADVLQCIVTLVVLLLVIVKGTMDTGGPEAVWENLSAGNRTDLFIWGSSPNSRYSVWTTIIGGYCLFGSYYSTHQLNMQRYLSNRTLKNAKISVYCGGIGFFVCHWFYAAVGLVMYAYYHKCDPLLGGRIKVYDQSVALFAVDVLSDFKGLKGVFIGGLMCATLSTLSSLLNMFAAVTVSDYVPVFKPHLSDKTLKNISRISVFVYGVVCIALVALVERMGNIAKTIFGIYGITSGAVFTTFTIGMLLPWVNTKGAVIGFLGSMVIPLWSWVGSFVKPQFLPHAPLSVEGCSNFTSSYNFTRKLLPEKTTLDEFYSLSYFWYLLMSLSSGLTIALIANKIIGFQDPRSVDQKLLFPFITKIICSQEQATLEDDVNRPTQMPLLEVKDNPNKI